ncbi:MAG: fldC [Hydrocarboniphaga sp.]|uniref:2-hydroxyacyl-CoA dehydratase subunit D n=1 Tax=Hydrocarboniphaga sp. TaxID=2033016 RepID=UPI00260CA64D|nr:2-hydroxyacyl-CoA dehydratase family protein [Hydrocarboniphaga sp.]MDB5971669.1 fldC [Hydrocarboniphaga sp.]
MTKQSRDAIAELAGVAENPDEYIAQWKRDKNRKVVGLMPMNFPAEIAHAAGALPVVIQQKRTPITIGNNRLTEFHCGYTRSVADQAAKKELGLYDGFMLADHCIQLLGASDIIRDESPEVPMYFGQLISSMGDPWSREQILKKMMSFVREIENFTGRMIHESDLQNSIQLFNENRRLLRQIFDARRAGDVTFKPSELQAFVKSSMVMDKQEHSALLRQVLETAAARPSGAGLIKLHISGHFCHAPKTELLELIEDCGAIIVDDDLFHGTRYISTDIGESKAPIEALADWYLDRNVAAPCPTRVQHDVDWDRYLLNLVAESGAEGLVVLMAKFCEPHMLYYPELRKALNARGIPHVLIETEHEGIPVETIRTRIEAMLERIRRKEPSAA